MIKSGFIKLKYAMKYHKYCTGKVIATSYGNFRCLGCNEIIRDIKKLRIVKRGQRNEKNHWYFR